MSLFNMVAGFTPHAPLYLNVLNMKADDLPRFRDVYKQGEYLVVLTRTGGGNREGFAEENDKLAKHKWYVHDEDDDFDTTFAHFYFKPPYEQIMGFLDDEHPMERFKRVVQEMKS